jgi:endonuclease-3 related protein
MHLPSSSLSPSTLISETQSRATRLRALYQQLLAFYGPQSWWPSRTPFETIIGAYLVQNTSWKGVVRSIANLEAHDALTPAGLRALSEEQLRTLIRPSGYMVRKAAALQAFVAFLDTHYAGSLESMAAQPTVTLRAQLLALPGVGPETADVILLYALGHPVMVVDEYLRRIAHRHGLAPAKVRYEELQQLALSAFSTDPPTTLLQHCNEFHALIVEAGKNHCGPTPRCEDCPLKPLLPLP